MGTLIFWVVAIIVIWALRRGGSDDTQGIVSDLEQKMVDDSAILQNDKKWINYIRDYAEHAKTKSQKEFVDQMLQDALRRISLTESSLYDANQEIEIKDARLDYVSKPKLDTEASSYVEDGTLPATSDKLKAANDKSMKLDNISILLYFGAFLFVASVGLFVAFSGANGWIRALSVLSVSLVMYILGQWIYNNKSSLKPAGLAFVGIGVSIAPLVGVAIYGYVDKSNPALVWMLTSALCIGLYTHAVITLRSSLLDYLFIFTLLSLFESFVSVFSLPVYYFGWVMVAIGLLLQIISLWKNVFEDFGEVSRAGGQVYVPLAIFVSLVVASSQGLGQLGLTLLLASVYYGLVFKASRIDSDRHYSAVASHVGFLVGVSSLVYGLTDSLVTTGLFLTILSLMHIAVIFAKPSDSVVRYNFASIMLGASMAGVFMTYDNGFVSSLVLVATVLQSLIVWWVQRRSDAYVLAGLGWTALPIFVMSFVLPDSVSDSWFAVLYILALVVHAVFYLALCLPRFIGSASMIHIARVVLIFGTLASGLVSLLFGGIISMIAIGLVAYLLAWRDKGYIWSTVSGLVFASALMGGWDDSSLLWAGIIALVINIILSLHFRSESNRWISTVLWLLMPVIVSHALYIGGLEPMYYAWMYLVVMLALILSRFIARGSVLLSVNVPMIVYAKTASMSYVAGYAMAGFLAFCISVYSGLGNFGAVVISLLISAIMILVTRFIEKDPEISVLQPILWQVIAFGFLRSINIDVHENVFIGLSTVVAVFIYGLAYQINTAFKESKVVDENTVIFSLATSFIAPAYYFVSGTTEIAMIIGLFVASGLTYHYWRSRPQGYKEIGMALSTTAVMWGMYYYGIRELQAYTHAIAIMLALFAWLRHTLGQTAKTDEYIYGALSVTTVPLVIQAVSSDSDGIYGWLLLLEQVLFMLIGMAIRKRFVMMWGLYVAVASVLYQLRNLGYAALAFLAVFVIGIAVYQLQKYNKQD